jgi:hypothetical protein
LCCLPWLGSQGWHFGKSFGSRIWSGDADSGQSEKMNYYTSKIDNYNSKTYARHSNINKFK